jgi:hypothetical protein
MRSMAASWQFGRVGASALAWLCLLGPASAADGKPDAGIYTCIDDKGRKLTSDRPIPECTAKEQRVLNKDGSLKTIHPPTLTAEERADKEARDRKAAEQRAAMADAVRRDRNLMARFPTEEAHHKAREAALDTVRLAMRASDQRLKDLAAERKPLLDEAEFYKGRTMPLKLKQALDANDAGTEAQKTAMANQEAEIGRINKLYDAELDRLRRLWAGAQPGTLGPLAAAEMAASSSKR